MIREEIQHLAIGIDEVHPHPRNVRQGDVGAICESLKAHGQYRSIIYQKSTGRILAGNHTWKAAKSLGWPQIAATPVVCDDDQALRILLADNRANDLAAYDDNELIDLLKELAVTEQQLEGTLFDGDALDELIADDERYKLPEDADDLPEQPPATSKTGDLWLLGPHRLLCGDSLDHANIELLMDGKEADMVWTDPPYGVAYVGKTKDALTIENDDMDIDSLTEFLRQAFTNAYNHCKAGACWYVASPSGNLFQAFSIPLTELGVWRHTLVWVKDTLVMGRADYHYRHESIFYGWKEGAAHQTPPDRKQDTVWEIPRPKRNAEHPTMKPIELMARAIQNSSRKGDLVLDPFGGSGSTLIAADQTGRICNTIELDPKYVDVICARYQTITGTQPVLAATGQPHNFLDA